MRDVAIFAAMLLALWAPLAVPALRRTEWRREWWKWPVGVATVGVAFTLAVGLADCHHRSRTGDVGSGYGARRAVP